MEKHLEDKPAPASDQAPLLGTATRCIQVPACNRCYQQDEEAFGRIALAQCTRNASAAARTLLQHKRSPSPMQRGPDRPEVGDCMFTGRRSVLRHWRQSGTETGWPRVVKALSHGVDEGLHRMGWTDPPALAAAAAAFHVADAVTWILGSSRLSSTGFCASCARGCGPKIGS